MASLHGRIEEGAIVGHDQEARLGAAHPVLQPEGGGEVEVVGGFVEQVEVGRPDQEAGQQGATRLPAGEASGVRLRVEVEPGEHSGGASLDVVTAGEAVSLLGRRVGVKVLLARVGEAGCRLVKFPAEAAVLLGQHCLGQPPGPQLSRLRQEGDAAVTMHDAGVGPVQPGRQPQ
jgi:hypothetical protein